MRKSRFVCSTILIISKPIIIFPKNFGYLFGQKGQFSMVGDSGSSKWNNRSYVVQTQTVSTSRPSAPSGKDKFQFLLLSKNFAWEIANISQIELPHRLLMCSFLGESNEFLNTQYTFRHLKKHMIC